MSVISTQISVCSTFSLTSIGAGCNIIMCFVWIMRNNYLIYHITQNSCKLCTCWKKKETQAVHGVSELSKSFRLCESELSSIHQAANSLFCKLEINLLIILFIWNVMHETWVLPLKHIKKWGLHLMVPFSFLWMTSESPVSYPKRCGNFLQPGDYMIWQWTWYLEFDIRNLILYPTDSPLGMAFLAW